MGSNVPPMIPMRGRRGRRHYVLVVSGGVAGALSLVTVTVRDIAVAVGQPGQSKKPHKEAIPKTSAGKGNSLTISPAAMMVSVMGFPVLLTVKLSSGLIYR
jgi:hypothetical protein